MEHGLLEDRLLLQRFVKDNSQEAFATLTARYLNLVYAACRRELADADTAEDVTQAVFLILARKAPSLGRSVVLSGWLFQTARFAAKNARLQATRRAAYEQKAAEALMEQQAQTEDKQWADIEPLLNQSLVALKSGERDCVLLRFFQGASFVEIGTSLGLSEETARKRVARSLDKMRQFFTKNGVIVPAIALPVLLTAHAAKAAPATCQANITALTHSVLAGHTTAALTGSHAYQLSEGILQAMKIAQIKLSVGITATAVLSLYAASYAISQTAHTDFVFTSAAKPGYVLHPATGNALTSDQIAARCLQAYAALQSYQGTTTVNTQVDSAHGRDISHTSTNIQFEQPGKIRGQGMDVNGTPFGFVSDGATSEQTYVSNWKKADNVELAYGGLSAISNGASQTLPALLLASSVNKRGFPIMGIPLPLCRLRDPEVREDTFNGQLCYVLTAHLTVPTLKEVQYLWVDEKTFRVHRFVNDAQNPDATVAPLGFPIHITAARTYNDDIFTNERINETLLGSTFALPVVQ